MSRYARVDSLDSLQALKVALVKFAEAASVALADAESEISRTMNWLENEQTAHWKTQIRKRQQLVERCKEALRQKKLFPDALGRPQSTFDEEKAVRKAVAMLEEAEQKLANTRKYVTVMRREQQNYKGGVQRFYTCVEADVPGAVAQLSGMLATLKAYVATGPASAVSEAGGAAGAPAASMARGEAADGGTVPAKSAEQPGAGGVDKKEGEA
jgi:hypothetical protein